jgi:hypothetical protein
LEVFIKELSLEPLRKLEVEGELIEELLVVDYTVRWFASFQNILTSLNQIFIHIFTRRPLTAVF